MPNPSMKQCDTCGTWDIGEFYYCKDCGSLFDNYNGNSEDHLRKTIQFGKPDFDRPPPWLIEICKSPQTKSFLILRELLQQGKAVRWYIDIRITFFSKLQLTFATQERIQGKLQVTTLMYHD